MKYAISDVHGCFDAYEAMLGKIQLKASDTLYILGDLIDRGPHGCRVFLDASSRPNVKCIMGNHEAMARTALAGVRRVLREENDFTETELEALQIWFYNGGGATLSEFLELSPEEQHRMWEHLERLPLYEKTNAGGRSYVLVHGGLENFDPLRPLNDYSEDEVLWCRPEVGQKYYENWWVVFGHTPVQVLRPQDFERGLPARFVKWEKLIDIDCGCVFPGGRLGCLTLDTLSETYTVHAYKEDAAETR